MEVVSLNEEVNEFDYMIADLEPGCCPKPPTRSHSAMTDPRYDMMLLQAAVKL